VLQIFNLPPKEAMVGWVMAANTRFATGVHALVLLAAEPDGLQTSEDIAGQLNINPVVIRRVFSSLHQAGLLDSQKGPHGGSRLARPAKGITLRDIYEALDGGELFHSAAVVSAQTAKVGSALKKVFGDAEKALRDELDKTRLSDLVKKAGKKGKK
jgi:Rrf2 family protein